MLAFNQSTTKPNSTGCLHTSVEPF